MVPAHFCLQDLKKKRKLSILCFNFRCLRVQRKSIAVIQFFFFVISVINIYNCDICSFLVVKEKILFVLIFKGDFVLFDLV